MDAIVAYDLSKQYGERIALCGLNLQIPQGSIFACVGGEQSGKTTMVRLLSGLCRPNMGECTVMGYSPGVEPERLHTVSGTVLETARLYGQMTLSANLNFFAAVNGIDSNDAIDRSSFLMHKLDIWEGREEKVSDLSTGMVRRASLARALMHRPQVLLIDEPAGGIDQETMDRTQELISYLREEEGVTVLLCTRNLAYAQLLCSGFAILRQGSLLAKGDLESLRKAAGLKYRAAFRFAGEEDPPDGFYWMDGFWQKNIEAESDMPRLVSEAVSSGKRVYEAKLLKPTLEEIYKAYMDGGMKNGGETFGEERTEEGVTSATRESTEEFLSEEEGGGGAEEG